MILQKPRSARWLAAMLLLGATCTASAERPRGPANVDAMQAREADDIALLLHLRPDQRGALVAFLSAWGPPPPPRDGGEGPNMRPGPSMPGGGPAPNGPPGPPGPGGAWRSRISASNPARCGVSRLS